VPRSEAIRLPASDERATVRSFHLPREGRLWLLAIIVMFVTGVFKTINLLILLAYLLAGLFIMNAWLVRRDLTRLNAGRHLDGPIFAGQPFTSTIQISQTIAPERRGLVVQDGPERHLLLRLTNREPLWLRSSRTIGQRGRHAAPPVLASSRFPFGLVGRAVQIAPAEEWVVLPQIGTLQHNHFWDWLARQTRGDGRGRLRHRITLQEADVRGLREFRQGDSPRWIHWRSSARRNQVLVREYEDPSPPALLLVVEPWLPATPSAIDRDRLEALIRFAATLVWEISREPLARFQLIVSTYDRPIQPLTIPMLEVLAVENGSASTVPPGWCDRLSRSASHMPILVLTSNLNSTLAESISRHVGRLAAGLLASSPISWYVPPRPTP